MKCADCGGQLVERAGFVMRPWGREIPTSAVYAECEACGAGEITGSELTKAEVEAATVLLTEIDHPIEGRDLQWARKVSGVRKQEMAPYLGMSEAEYEALEGSSDPVPLPIRFAMAWFVREFGPNDSAPLAMAG